MKKLIAFIVLSLTYNAEGDDIMANSLTKETRKDASFVGSTDLTDVKAAELSVLGPLKFHNLTVTGDSDIMGSVRESQNGMFQDLSILGAVQAENIICKTLDVAGPVNVSGLTIKGDANISGTLHLKASTNPEFPNTFQNLNISAEEIILEDTIVNGDIVIHPTFKNKALRWFKEDRPQVLTLSGQTIVKGNITFVSGKGKIKQSPKVRIEGKIMGGIIE